ncbi:energy-coupling factor ABC transporter ATP-binding protein [Fundicoccus culcitae]|uniref:Energy-coupling factor transporter ATP-binding protein EcfA2 n=1 Tax=Fundicoccus culcitae TaxID=2969821 RepID=A0ABY5P2A6_9LACT|nr:energy-coupling factor ABC transporter ATP-binding protein [Fundicoccus culcitae]UUX32842.1 energy-coupling factor ABC transporter ATP-binding protein [Fundicoccus culcitae]
MANDIVFKQVDYTYNADTPFAFAALKNVNLTIPANQVTAIIGHTGSGKSTLLQHLNVLVRPTSGSVNIAGEEVTAESKHQSLKALRKKVGVVFQFPEAQLFEETVLKDVMFGPLNFDVSEEDAERIAKEKLTLVGIDASLYKRSPFDLSGGQMRRVAIAGVLALEPEILVLDEPTAGLDPLGHVQMMEMFMQLQQEDQLTLVLVTHQMEDVAQYANHVIVMEKGTVVRQGTPAEIFSEPQWLEERQLGLPQSVQFLERLSQEVDLPDYKHNPPLTVEALADFLVEAKENQHRWEDD